MVGAFVSSVVMYFIDELTAEQKKIISEESASKLLKSSSALESILKSVIDGNICLDDFVYLNERKDKLLNLCSVTDSFKSQSQRQILQDSFIQRERQRKSYTLFISDVTSYLASCEKHVKGQFL